MRGREGRRHEMNLYTGEFRVPGENMDISDRNLMKAHIVITMLEFDQVSLNKLYKVVYFPFFTINLYISIFFTNYSN